MLTIRRKACKKKTENYSSGSRLQYQQQNRAGEDGFKTYYKCN